jgi:hypothetical protein
MDFDHLETNQAPADVVRRLREQNWKATFVVLAIGFSICIIGAVVASQKDRDIAVIGERVHRVGMVVMLVGMIGFLIGQRLEQISKWLGHQMNYLNDPPIAALTTNEDSSREAASAPRTGSRFQFSLGTFFLATTGIGIMTGLLFSLPGLFIFPFAMICNLMLTVTLTITLIYGKGYLKTFCIGALIVSGTMVFANAGVFGYGMFVYNQISQFLPNYTLYRILVLSEWIVVVLLGFFGVFVRVMVERSSKLNSRRP